MHDISVLAAGPLDHLSARPVVGSGSGVEDWSAMARVGFRGRHAAGYLQQRGFTLPAQPNQARWQADGTLVARLSQSEYLLLAEPPQASQRLIQEEQGWQMSRLACYLLPRQDTHAWIALRGDYLPQMMSRLCAVDLSAAAFPPGAIAQTSVARATAIVINASTAEQRQFWLLVDYSLAPWLWEVLNETQAEFVP